MSDTPNPGGTAPAPVPVPALAPAPAPAPTPSPAPALPPTIPLTVEEYQRLRGLEGQLAEIQKAQALVLEAKEAERLKAMADKGQVEQALEEQRKSWEAKHAEASARYTQLEAQIAGERKNAVIASALAGRELVGETAEAKTATAAMVRRLLDDEFEAVRDGSGALVVREKVTGRPADQVLAEKLASPQFALFFAATNRGGAGAGGMNQPGQISSSPAAGSLDAIVSQWKARQAEYQSFGLTAQRD